MEHDVPEDQDFDLYVRFFKMSACEGCCYFEKKLKKLEDLKKQAWIEINRRDRTRKKLKAKVEKGWIEPNASYDCAKLDREADELRQNLKKLDFKTQEITLSYGRHINENKSEERKSDV